MILLLCIPGCELLRAWDVGSYRAMRVSTVLILSDLTLDTTSIGAFSFEKGGISSSPISLSEAFPLSRCSVLRFDLGEKSTRVPSAAIPQALKYKGQKFDDG